MSLVARLRRHDVLVIAAMLALFLATQYPHALTLPFVNDDYIIIDRTRGASFAALWQRHDPMFGWYRPWSREVHYWVLNRLFGASELPFHLVSLTLWLAVMALYFVWVRRIAGRRAGFVAVAGLAALSLWGTPLLWVAGAQDLWALALGLAFLHFVASEQRVGAAISLVLALLSKESAAVLPGLATAFLLLPARRGLRETVRRTAPWWLVTAAWMIFHPTLGGRFFQPLPDTPETALRPSLLGTAGRTLLSQINLDPPPHPWDIGPALIQGALGALVLVLLVWLGASRVEAGEAGRPAGRGRAALFGAVWALGGWSALFMPSIGWHAYYGVLGSLGLWLALGCALAARPRGAVLVVAVLALLRSGQAHTPSSDWGSEWYLHRAGNLLGRTREELFRLHPTFPPHSRLFFTRIPGDIGLLAGDGPSLRVWYGDRTLRARFYSGYAPRAADEARGKDFFFAFDTTASLVEVRQGPESIVEGMRRSSVWENDHEALASLLVRASEFRSAAFEYGKLARLPGRWYDDLYAGVCLAAAGDSAAADSAYRLAAGRLRFPVQAIRDSARGILERMLAAR